MGALNTFRKKTSRKQRKKAISQKKSKSKYYKDLEIPAKLFFSILEDSEIDKLIIKGSPKKEELEKAWINIIDMFFTGRNDPKKELILKSQAIIRLIPYKMDMFTMYASILHSNPFNNEQLLELIDELKTVGLRINIKKDLNDEILRVLKQKIPALEIELKQQKEGLKELTKGDKLEFYSAIASLTKANNGVPLPENITLGFYLAYEKQLTSK